MSIRDSSASCMHACMVQFHLIICLAIEKYMYTVYLTPPVPSFKEGYINFFGPSFMQMHETNSRKFFESVSLGEE